MNFFGLFGSSSSVEPSIHFDDNRKFVRRYQSQAKQAGGGASGIQSYEQCALIKHGDNLRGQVIIRSRGAGNNPTIEHNGITLEFIGSIEYHHNHERNVQFSLSRIQLASTGESPLRSEATLYDFIFENLNLPFDSYDGLGISLRYYLKVSICKKGLAPVVHERNLWCINDQPPPTMGAAPLLLASRVTLEVGLEDFLHIEMTLEKNEYRFDEVIKGTLRFILVRINVRDVQVSLCRKELDASDGLLCDSQTILTSQILEGPAYKGDQIPVALDLAAVYGHLTPTMSLINKTFSVRYYVTLILRDFEGRKYYKQVEVFLLRPHDLHSGDLSGEASLCGDDPQGSAALEAWSHPPENDSFWNFNLALTQA